MVRVVRISGSDPAARCRTARRFIFITGDIDGEDTRFNFEN
jgi:hypothetical protein